MNKLMYTLLFLLATAFAKAQVDSPAPQMADRFREEGKIYVVIAVLSIIFLALIVYLVTIDVKLKKLENKK
jgi:heme export protein D (CcmD)